MKKGPPPWGASEIVDGMNPLLACLYITNLLLRLKSSRGFPTDLLPFRRPQTKSAVLNCLKASSASEAPASDNLLKNGRKTNPKTCEFIVFVVHGIGGTDAGLERNTDQFRDALETVRAASFRAVPCETHVVLINWKKTIAAEQENLLSPLRPESSGEACSLRDFSNSVAADVMYYMAPSRKGALVGDVCAQLSSAYATLQESDPERYANAKVAIVAYSLGSLIVYDLLTEKARLGFVVHWLFLWGSPLSAYLALTSPPSTKHKLPLASYYNIFHPLDPLAFRQEPLFYGEAARPAVPLSHWFREDAASAALEVAEAEEPRRLDFVLQAPGGGGIVRLMVVWSMYDAHGVYWDNKDVALFILHRLTGFTPRIK